MVRLGRRKDVPESLVWIPTQPPREALVVTSGFVSYASCTEKYEQHTKRRHIIHSPFASDNTNQGMILLAIANAYRHKTNDCGHWFRALELLDGERERNAHAVLS